MDESRVPTVDVSLLDDARLLQATVVEVRRRIHRHPELGLELPGTQSVVLEALDGLGLDVSLGRADDLGGGGARRRAPRARPPSCGATWTGCRWSSTPASTTPRRSNGPCTPAATTPTWPCWSGPPACCPVAAASLPGRVVLMFQPGEEWGGGAQVMLEEGLLERARPDRPGLRHPRRPHACPRAGWPPGPARCWLPADEFRIVVTGRGGHASMPHDAVDPVPVACEIVTALQSMVTATAADLRPGRGDRGENRRPAPRPT